MAFDAQQSISHKEKSAAAVTPSGGMAQQTVDRLLALNRDFYATISPHFDLTRGNVAPGMIEAIGRLRVLHKLLPDNARVLDAGCGNGRFAWGLESEGIKTAYLGIDGDASLLRAAERQSAELDTVKTTWMLCDLATTDLSTLGNFDLIVCLAVLHHFPSRAARQALMQNLANAMASDAVLLVSTWQFLEDERLRNRQLPWESIGLSSEDVEEGDALLPWDQGVHAVRYAHQIDAAEVANLAASAGLTVLDSFRADGKSGLLNLYSILVSSSV